MVSGRTIKSNAIKAVIYILLPANNFIDLVKLSEF